MSYQLIFHPDAEQEYVEAFRWYEKQRPGLGYRFEEYIEKCLKKIVSHPEHYSIIKGQYREASTEIFPYAIVYKVNKRKKLIYISAVYHHKRNPDKKFRE